MIARRKVKGLPLLDGRVRAAGLCALLVAANAAAWGWAWLCFGADPVLLGTAFLAYCFGLRHAFDADHIAAIDNATRKLIETRQEAGTTGLFFSLGHATVVVLAALAIAVATDRIQPRLASFAPVAGALSTGFSAVCLFALALANCVILFSIARLFKALRSGVQPVEAELRRLLSQRGLLGRLLRGLFRLISKSWHMYPLGFLFGLGFDTATEIAVLAVAATQASHGLPLPMIMAFPLLFTAGMMLIDTLNSLLMTGAYRWASVEPWRKLYYNSAITFLSVVVAVVVGAIELLGLLSGAGTGKGFWPLIAELNDHLAAIGALIVALFVISWLISALAWRGRSASSG